MINGKTPLYPVQSDDREDEASPTGSPQANTRARGSLARIYQSLTLFSKLTDKIRQRVDQRLAAHLTVTGWDGATLRVTLDQPALATRWRFQEPALMRHLTTNEAGDLAGLREIRLVISAPGTRGAPRRSPSRLDQVPSAAVRGLAATETHEEFRRALVRLAEAAEKARKGT